MSKITLSENELSMLSPTARAAYLKSLNHEADKAVTYSASNGREALASLFIVEILRNHPNRVFSKTELVTMLATEPYGITVRRQTVARYTKVLSLETRYHIVDTNKGVFYEKAA